MNHDKRYSVFLSFGGLKDIETQTNRFIFENSSDMCIICNKHTDNTPSIQLHCNHIFCFDCLKRLAKQQMENEDNVQISCPICNNPLNDTEIDQLDPKYTKILEKRFMKKHNIISCPNCKEAFEHVPGNVAYIITDSFGEKIRPESLECLKLNRVTCFRCHTTFCAKCKTIPFHDGITCEEQVLLTKGIICRFCQTSPAIGCEKFDVCHRVCWRKHCKQSLKESCMTICACGHPCCGLKDENSHFGCALCEKNLKICVFCNKSCVNYPSVRMKCGHPAHKKCLIEFYTKIDMKEQLHVPICNFDNKCQSIPMHDCVNKQANKWIDISNRINEITNAIIKSEDIDKEPKHVNNPNDPVYYKQPKKYAKDFFVFYLCEKCQNPFFAGYSDEINNINNNNAHICIKCRIFPDAPDDLDAKDVINIANNIVNNISKKGKPLISKRIVHLGIRKVFHATSTKSAQSIMNDQLLKPGKNGMFGAGIYFASSEEIAKKKCMHVHHEVSAFVHCHVDFGNALVLEEPQNDLSYDELKEYGCNSVMGRSAFGRKWEFVVYDGNRTYPIKVVAAH